MGGTINKRTAVCACFPKETEADWHQQTTTSNPCVFYT